MYICIYVYTARVCLLLACEEEASIFDFLENVLTGRNGTKDRGESTPKTKDISAI